MKKLYVARKRLSLKDDHYASSMPIFAGIIGTAGPASTV